MSRPLAAPKHRYAPQTSLRDELKRVTRQRLVAAAEDLFQEQGFRATTVDQIAKLAGTTVTTFYRYFKSKSELVHLLQHHLSAEVLKVLKKLEAIRNPTRKSVRAWVNVYFDMWQRMHVLCAAYWEATAAERELAIEIMPSSLAMTGQLTELIERFPVRLKANGQLRLTVLILAMDRVAYIVDSQGLKDPSQSKVLDEYSEVLWRGLFEPL